MLVPYIGYMAFLACAIIITTFLKRGSFSSDHLTALSRFVHIIIIFAPVYILILVLLKSAGFHVELKHQFILTLVIVLACLNKIGLSFEPFASLVILLALLEILCITFVDINF
jgi:Na+/serine symporter